MVTKEEREEIINETIEQMLKMLPEVVGNLMTANAMYSKLTKDFYNDHLDFKDHKEIVSSVVSKIEGKDPTVKYEDILKEAVPLIREQIKLKGKVNMEPVVRDKLDLTFEPTDNGLL